MKSNHKSRREILGGLSMTKTEKILLLIAAAFFLLALLLVPRSGTARAVEPAYEKPLPGAEAAADEDALYVTIQKRVDLNHADAAALTALPGVGKTTAEAIVAYRDEHGPFSSVEELLLVPGFSTATLEAILAAREG